MRTFSRNYRNVSMAPGDFRHCPTRYAVVLSVYSCCSKLKST